MNCQIKDYTSLTQLFLSLRGRGCSVSAADLDILCAWEQAGISPHFVAGVMVEMAAEYEEKSQVFPGTLVPLAHRIQGILSRAQNL